MSYLFSAEEPDRLRGKQHMKLWCDELAAWRRPDAFDQAMLGLRLGDRPQMVVTTTPRPTRIIKQLAADKDTIVTRGSTFENGPSGARVPRAHRRALRGTRDRPAGAVRRDRRGDAGRLVDARADRAPARRAGGCAAGIFRDRGAVDPPARSGSKADECGLVVAGKAADGRIYVLADLTSQGDTPAAWAARVGAAYRGFPANRVVAEVNNGGEMVTEVLRQADPTAGAHRHRDARQVPARRADRGGLRARPRLHAGVFAKLEDQLCALTPDFDAAPAPRPTAPTRWSGRSPT